MIPPMSEVRPREPIIVFIHGQPGGARDFTEVISRLLGELRVVAYDRPGWGSNKLKAMNVEGNVAYLQEKLVANGASRVILVGYSYGSAIALLAAIKTPKMIRGLILIAPVGGLNSISLLDRFLVFPARYLRLLRHFVRLFKRSVRSKAIESFYVEQVRLKGDLLGLAEGISSITVPVELIVGMNDFLNPLNGTLQLFDSLPNANIKLLKGMGHLLLTQSPEIIAEQIFSMWSDQSDR